MVVAQKMKGSVYQKMCDVICKRQPGGVRLAQTGLKGDRDIAQFRLSVGIRG